MNILLKAILLTVFMTTTVLAAEYNGSGKYVISTPHLINIEYKWKLWTLMGEPVDELVARWNIQSVSFHNLPKSSRDKLKNPVTNSFYYEVCYDNKEYKGCIPKSIMEKTRIVEMKFTGSSNLGFIGYKYKFDAGVMSKPYVSHPNAADNSYGKWSYNTPGSKSWDESFLNLTAAESKKIMKSGLKLPYFKINTIRLDLTQVMIYILDRNKKHYKNKNIKKSYSAMVNKLKKGAAVMERRLQATKARVAKRALPVNKANGVWIDKDTDLMWQNKQFTKEEIKAYKTGKKYKRIQTWEMAKNYCRNINYAGYTDWYMPSKNELKLLYRKVSPLKSSDRTHEFWSSTEDEKDRSDKVYIVNGVLGTDFTYYKHSGFLLRCVRAGQ